jgi:Ca2+-binding EF-hand superfamily protein
MAAMKPSSLFVIGAALSSIFLASCETNQPQRGGGGGGQSPDRKTMFIRIDQNGDGVVTRQEFMASPNAQRNPDQAPQVFRRMDRNGNGTLSRQEFVAGP